MSCRSHLVTECFGRLEIPKGWSEVPVPRSSRLVTAQQDPGFGQNHTAASILLAFLWGFMNREP